MKRVPAVMAATAIALLGAVLLVFTAPAQAKPQGSKAALTEFRRLNPCPSTGAPGGSCPGHVVALVVPRCAEGQAAVDNMQWQTVAQSRQNGRWVRQYCQFHRARAQELAHA